jgi:exonuclease VII small subunit
MSKETNKENLSAKLKKLGTIVSWFEDQEEIDVEKGLELVKEGAVLIKQSKEQLKEIENEFKEIKKDLGGE